jgi:hypothetical protein
MSTPTQTPASNPDPSTVPNQPISILILSPNGGENWLGGTKEMITWKTIGVSGSTSVDLEYSISGVKGSWIPIASDLSGTNAFEWIVPNSFSIHSYIRASVNDSENPTQIVSTVSDDAFEISAYKESSSMGVAVFALMLLPATTICAYILGVENAKTKHLQNLKKQKRTSENELSRT